MSTRASDPQISQRIDRWPAEQRRHHAFVGQHQGQRIIREAGGHGRPVPQHEAKIQAEPLSRMGKKLGEAGRA